MCVCVCVFIPHVQDLAKAESDLEAEHESLRGEVDKYHQQLSQVSTCVCVCMCVCVTLHLCPRESEFVCVALAVPGPIPHCST